jgi:hypothetical protein
VIIEVASIRPPKEGKKVATVVAASGQSFEAWLEKAAKLSVGAHYEVEVETREWNGTKAKPVAAAPAANGHAAIAPAPEVEFVTAVLAAFVEVGKVDLDGRQLADAVSLLRAVWLHGFGGSKSNGAAAH